MKETKDRVAPDRFLSSGDEAGTAPGDHWFRPDIEGLRLREQRVGSESVEGQFFVICPALFIGVATMAVKRFDLGHRISLILGAATVVSFWWSVAQTSSNATAAHFWPLTFSSPTPDKARST